MDWKEILFNELKDLRSDFKADMKEMTSKQSDMNKDLASHIRRTEQNEEAIKAVKAEIKPLKKHYVGIKYIGTVVFGIGALGTVITKLIGLW